VNYRLNVTQTEQGKHMLLDPTTMDKAALKAMQREQWELVHSTIMALDAAETRPAALKMLLKADELIASLKKEELLIGFKEPYTGPTFHPTFKVHRWEPEKYVTKRTVRVFRQKSTLEAAIGSHACSLEANMRVTNGIHLKSSLLLPFCTVIPVQTLKASHHTAIAFSTNHYLDIDHVCVMSFTSHVQNFCPRTTSRCGLVFC
jgi:hypothetical protein